MKSKLKAIKELPLQERTFQIRKEDIDEKNRTVNLSFSSEYKVERWYGLEILDHRPGAARLDRLNNGGALLVMHDRAKQVGVTESAEIDSSAKRGNALVRFGKSDYAEEIFQDVIDGIRRNVSMRYRNHKMKLEVESSEGPDEYRITDWEPYEISLEPTPADPSVGVGRSENEGEKYPINMINNRSNKMTEEERKQIEDEARAKFQKEQEDEKRKVAEKEKIEADARAKVVAESKEAGDKEASRAKEIIAIGENFNMRDEANEALKNGTFVEDFRKASMDKLVAEKRIDANTNNLGMPEKDKDSYSILRAIDAQMKKDWSKAGLELEASRAHAKLVGKEPRGFFIPQDIIVRTDLLFGKRDVSVSGAPALVATDHLAGSFIDLLRNQSAVVGLGALMLSGLRGDVSIPKQTGAATAYWVTEGGTTTESTPTFGTLTLGPKTVSGRVDITRRMQLQSNPAINALVLFDLARVLGLAIDLASIAGTGSGGQPTGILNTSGIGDVTGTSLDWAAVVEFETDVAEANGDIGSMAYLTRASVNGILKTREKSANTAKYLVDGGEMNGYKVAVSNQIAAATMIFGVWSQLIIGFWSGLDVKLDEVTLGDSGGLVVRAFQDADVGVRHPASFSASDEIS